MAPEAAYFDDPIREIFHGSGNRGTYRIIFTVINDAIFILHVRHGSQDVLRESS